MRQQTQKEEQAWGWGAVELHLGHEPEVPAGLQVELFNMDRSGMEIWVRDPSWKMCIRSIWMADATTRLGDITRGVLVKGMSSAG